MRLSPCRAESRSWLHTCFNRLQSHRWSRGNAHGPLGSVCNRCRSANANRNERSDPTGYGGGTDANVVLAQGVLVVEAAMFRTVSLLPHPAAEVEHVPL